MTTVANRNLRVARKSARLVLVSAMVLAPAACSGSSTATPTTAAASSPTVTTTQPSSNTAASVSATMPAPVVTTAAEAPTNSTLAPFDTVPGELATEQFAVVLQNNLGLTAADAKCVIDYLVPKLTPAQADELNRVLANPDDTSTTVTPELSQLLNDSAVFCAGGSAPPATTSQP